MATKRHPAVSYSRFSDPKQAKGDSQERQEKMFADFCRLHELTPLPEVFADRGLSGFRGAHRKKGRLGQLIEQAQRHGFEPGTVIVVEAWDRLGRQRPDKQTELIAELLRTGVSIGVCRLNDIFKEEDFGTHKWTTLAVFIQLAYQESLQKSDRGKSAWATRREKAREDGTVLTSRLPAWLEVINGAPRPVPERVAALKVIFKLSADGFGQVRIVRALTDGKLTEGQGPSRMERALPGGPVPPFGTDKWTRTYLDKILRDRRVLGEYQPRKANGEPDGPVLPTYYPQVISETEYLLVRAGQEERRGRGGRRDRRYVNVFRGLLVHARDGEGFILNNHGTGDRPRLVLVAAASKGGRNARSFSFPYPVFETAVLGCLAELDPRELLPKEAGPSLVEVLRARLGNARAQVKLLQKELRDGYSKAVAAVLREQEALAEKLAGELMEEEARAARPAEAAWGELPGLVDLIQAGGDEARLRMRVVLRRLVERIYVLTVPSGCRRTAAVQVRFGGGKQREYFIEYIPAANRREGRWRVASMRTSFGVHHPRTDWFVGMCPFDMADPEGVARVQELIDTGFDLECLEASPWRPLPGEEGPADRGGDWPAPEPLAPSVFEYKGPLGYDEQSDLGCEAPTSSADTDDRVQLEIVSTDPADLLDTALDHAVAKRMMLFDRQHPDATPEQRAHNARRLRREVLAEIASGQYRRDWLGPAPGAIPGSAARDDGDDAAHGLMDLIEPVARKRLGLP
jgi:DNA invertase Pin-like site-specific DNA recombinase